MTKTQAWVLVITTQGHDTGIDKSPLNLPCYLSNHNSGSQSAIRSNGSYNGETQDEGEIMAEFHNSALNPPTPPFMTQSVELLPPLFLCKGGGDYDNIYGRVSHSSCDVMHANRDNVVNIEMVCTRFINHDQCSTTPEGCSCNDPQALGVTSATVCRHLEYCIPSP